MILNFCGYKEMIYVEVDETKVQCPHCFEKNNFSAFCLYEETHSVDLYCNKCLESFHVVVKHENIHFGKYDKKINKIDNKTLAEQLREDKKKTNDKMLYHLTKSIIDNIEHINETTNYYQHIFNIFTSGNSSIDDDCEDIAYYEYYNDYGYYEIEIFDKKHCLKLKEKLEEHGFDVKVKIKMDKEKVYSLFTFTIDWSE